LNFNYEAIQNYFSLSAAFAIGLNDAFSFGLAARHFLKTS
jgi:hypothetical protein